MQEQTWARYRQISGRPERTLESSRLSSRSRYAVGGNALERGEEITLSYEDNGPSGADYVGDDTRDVELQIETSNFGATVELDQNVYTWTDKVFITVVASDYNFDSNIVDEIGTEDKGEITIRTRASEVQYRLAETGPTRACSPASWCSPATMRMP